MGKLKSENNVEVNLYEKNNLKNKTFLTFIFIILIFTSIIALRVGSYSTPIEEIVKGIFGLSNDEKINLVIQKNRLPRIVTAIVSGAGLGLAGCILQAILRNPLASASTLGVSQGASFGAAVAIVIFGMGSGYGIGVPLLAFLGSIFVALLILGLSRFRSVTPEGIVLSGVAISAMFTGATTLLQYFANEVQLASLVYWTFGNLSNVDWNNLMRMTVIVMALFLYCLFHRWDYNALLSGHETAKSLGINVRKLTLVNMVLCCLVTSIIVSNVGLISFIGLISPHIVRRIVGNNHVYLIPGSLLSGGLILLLSDIFSRIAIMPIVLPIGAITSFLGGPMFLYLLFKGRN